MKKLLLSVLFFYQPIFLYAETNDMEIEVILTLQKQKVLSFSNIELEIPIELETQIDSLLNQNTFKLNSDSFLPNNITSPTKPIPPETKLAELIIKDTPYKDNNIYSEKLDSAQRENKKLVVWINLYKPEVENSLQDCYHLHVSEFFSETSPQVLIGIPYNNIMGQYKLSAENATEDKIRGANFSKPLTQPAESYSKVYSEHPTEGRNCVGGG